MLKNRQVLFEINLLKNPFCVFCKVNPKRLARETIERGQSFIHYEAIGSDNTRRIWELNPTMKWGYTTHFDKKVLVTVLKLVTDEGLPPLMPWKLGSVSRLCHTMGVSDKGENPRLVKDSLIRISSTPIYAETFYLKNKKDYWRERPESIGGNFTLWSVFWKGDRLPDGRVAESIYLAFNIPFISSLQAYYVKPLDYGYWLSLPPLAQRLYELTGLKFYGLAGSFYARYEYPEFCQLLPIIPQKKLSDAQRILDRAHRILHKTHWLNDVYWEWFKKPWAIRYYPGPRAKEEITQARERLKRFKSWRQRELVSIDPDRLAQAQDLVKEIERVTGDTHSRGAFTLIARKVPSQRIWQWLSEVKLAHQDHLHGVSKIKQSRSALFMDKARRYCQERNLDIGIKFRPSHRQQP